VNKEVQGLSSPIAAPTSSRWGSERGAEQAVSLITLVVAAAWLLQLARNASGARFQTDECFHAYRPSGSPGTARSRA